MNKTQTKTNSAQEPQVLNIRGASRQRFLINGDPNKVLELNITDLGVIERIHLYYPKLKEIELKVNQIKADNILTEDGTDFDEEGTQKFVNSLNECDSEMRKYMDLIFDAEVSNVCDCGGTMYDPMDGQLRYECIIADLSEAYGDAFKQEFNKMSAKRESHTSKYTKKKK